MRDISHVKDTLVKEIPTYHTREMRRDFVNSFGSVCDVKSYVLREAYKRLSGDASAAENSTEKEINNRVSEALDMSDPVFVPSNGQGHGLSCAYSSIP